MGELKRAFECVICRLPCKSPDVAVCCEHVVGCDKCVKKWCATHSCCPLGSVESRLTDSFILVELLAFLGLVMIVNQSWYVRESVLVVDGNPTPSEDSANEFEEMPSFRSTLNSA